jgi:type II secretory pathway component PulF
VGLLNYTLQQDTSLENLSNPTLMVFVGGGVLIIFVVIYLLFIKE